jgi:tetratricopeptide (TPR) repeat protein
MLQKDQNILAMETTGYIDTGFGFKVGDEYRMNFGDSGAALRMGFRAGNELDSVTNLTAGVGIYHDFGDVEASLDYAFVPYSALGDTHRVTINLVAGNKPTPIKVTLGPGTSFILGQGSLDIPVTVKHGAPVNSWKVDILNDQGQLVKSVTGKGDPSDHFHWDGKDEKGELVPKGRYTLKMEATDEDGQTDKATPTDVRAKWQPKKVKYQYTYQVQGDLLFKSGSSELRKEGYAVIQKAVADIQAKYPGSDIQVAGHTDNVKVMPGRKYKSNQELSQARAESVRDFLVGNGVDPNHLSAQGYGDKKPIASNDTWAGKRKNRRVELVVSGASDVTSEDLIPKGKEAMAAKHYKEALEIFEKALESDDRDSEAYALSGDCLWALDEKEKAVERYRSALKYDPNNQAYKDWIDAHAPNPLRDLLSEANRAVAKGEHKAALSALQKALKYDDHNASIYELMGNSHLALKDEDQAIADYKKSLELDPTNQALKDKLRKLAPTPAEVSNDLTQEAYGDLRANKFQEALPVLLKAIETDPQNAKAYQLAGNCYWRLGDKMKGITYCRKSLEIEPNNPGLKAWMTTVETKLQTASAAEDLVNQGRDSIRKGKYQEALPTLLKAIETYPKNPRAYQLAGNCYWQLGEKAKGLDYCRKALALDPNNASLAAWVKAAEAKLKAPANR